MKKLLKNCRMYKENDIINIDILIENDTIVKMGDIPVSNEYEVVDIENNYVSPGFIDFHVHLDDKIGGYEIADSYKSGSEVAIKNGITTIMSFITQQRGETLRGAIDRTQAKAKNNIWCDVGWHLTPTTFDAQSYGEIAEIIQDGACSFKLYTTYKKAGLYSDYRQIKSFTNEFSKYEVLTLVHCEDDGLIAEREKNNHKFGIKDFVKTRSKSVEISAIRRILRIARKNNAPIHFVHVSTKEGMELIKSSKLSLPLSSETCPQYLYLSDDNYVGYNGSQYLCNPPLRDSENVSSLKDMFKIGLMDIMASDHCPFTIENKVRKNNSYDNIPGGLCGLDFIPYLLSNIYYKEIDKLKQLTYKLSETPARLSGVFPEKGILEVGSLADIVVLNFGNLVTLKGREGIFNPYSDISSDLNIKKVFLHGDLVVDNGSLIGKKPSGTML